MIKKPVWKILLRDRDKLCGILIRLSTKSFDLWEKDPMIWEHTKYMQHTKKKQTNKHTITKMRYTADRMIVYCF